jgi:outer membrane protein assembly factor BamB
MILMMIASPMLLFAEEGRLDWIQNVEFENQYIMQTSSCVDHENNLIHTYNYMGQNEESIMTWDIQKLDHEGVLLWETTLLSETNYEGAIKVTVDGDGNIYAAGNISNDEIFSVIRVVKLDPNGTIVWDTSLSHEWTELQNLMYREDGYLAVIHQSMEEWGITTLYTSDDQMGEVAWTSNVYNIEDNSLVSLEFSGIDSENRITLLGSIYASENMGIGWVRFEADGSNGVTGFVNGESENEMIGDTKMDQDGNICTLFGLEGLTTFKLICISNNGELAWSVQVNGTIPEMYETSIVLTQNGPVIAYSTDEGSVNIFKRSRTDGSELWTTQLNSSIGFLPRSSLVLDEDGTIYMIGADFRMIDTYTMVGLTPEGETENWILNFRNPSISGNVIGIPQHVEFRNDAIYCVALYSNWETETMGLDRIRVDVGATSSVDQTSDILPQAFTVDAYPNPFNASLNVKMDIAAPGEIKVRLVDMLGRTVYEVKENMGNGNHVLSVNANDLTSGMYLLEVKDRNGNRVAKRVTLLK